MARPICKIPGCERKVKKSRSGHVHCYCKEHNRLQPGDAVSLGKAITTLYTREEGRRLSAIAAAQAVPVAEVRTLARCNWPTCPNEVLPNGRYCRTHASWAGLTKASAEKRAAEGERTMLGFPLLPGIDPTKRTVILRVFGGYPKWDALRDGEQPGEVTLKGRLTGDLFTVYADRGSAEAIQKYIDDNGITTQPPTFMGFPVQHGARPEEHTAIIRLHRGVPTWCEMVEGEEVTQVMLPHGRDEPRKTVRCAPGIGERVYTYALAQRQPAPTFHGFPLEPGVDGGSAILRMVGGSPVWQARKDGDRATCINLLAMPGGDLIVVDVDTKDARWFCAYLLRTDYRTPMLWEEGLCQHLDCWRYALPGVACCWEHSAHADRVKVIDRMVGKPEWQPAPPRTGENARYEVAGGTTTTVGAAIRSVFGTDAIEDGQVLTAGQVAELAKLMPGAKDIPAGARTTVHFERDGDNLSIRLHSLVVKPPLQDFQIKNIGPRRCQEMGCIGEVLAGTTYCEDHKPDWCCAALGCTRLTTLEPDLDKQYCSTHQPSVTMRALGEIEKLLAVDDPDPAVLAALEDWLRPTYFEPPADLPPGPREQVAPVYDAPVPSKGSPQYAPDRAESARYRLWERHGIWLPERLPDDEYVTFTPPFGGLDPHYVNDAMDAIRMQAARDWGGREHVSAHAGTRLARGSGFFAEGSTLGKGHVGREEQELHKRERRAREVDRLIAGYLQRRNDGMGIAECLDWLRQSHKLEPTYVAQRTAAWASGHGWRGPVSLHPDALASLIRDMKIEADIRAAAKAKPVEPAKAEPDLGRCVQCGGKMVPSIYYPRAISQPWPHCSNRLCVAFGQATANVSYDRRGSYMPPPVLVILDDPQADEIARHVGAVAAIADFARDNGQPAPDLEAFVAAHKPVFTSVNGWGRLPGRRDTPKHITDLEHLHRPHKPPQNLRSMCETCRVEWPCLPAKLVQSYWEERGARDKLERAIWHHEN